MIESEEAKPPNENREGGGSLREIFCSAVRRGESSGMEYI